MTILPINNNIKWIVHVSDIHCRLNKRILEYQEVFNNFFNDIKKLPKDETIIVNTGDTFHNKNEMQPEGIQLVKELFIGCSELFPTIIIAGQHDAILSNKNRLDAITPIIEMLNHPNLYYLKSSGLYGFGNILFNNMSVFDDPDKYILGKNIPSIYRNQYEHIIALFHGTVDGACTETGYRLTNPLVMTPLFDYHHSALLGDIHLSQNMQDYDDQNNKPCIRYAGSLIIQNYGELLKNHGYSLWDLSNHSYTHHEINNDYGYFTVEVQKGKLVTDLSDLPKKTRLRIKCFESIPSEVKAVIANIKEKTEVIETVHMRMDKERDKSDIIPLNTDIVLTDLTNVDYQNRLITEFITKKLGIEDTKKVDGILAINRNTNALIKRDEFARNLKWKPIKMEWSNTFTYGEDNVINFENMAGSYGIFGPNKSGKSSILDTMLFCLFDKTSRGYKGSSILNAQKTSFKCKLEFEISGVRYFIERKGTTTRTGNVKVDVRFWKIVNGEEEELHGTERSDTNDIIRDYVGTYEDFVITSASFEHAKNNTSFIDMGNSERKDLLVQFLGLGIFDRLHEFAGERNKDLKTILKLHKDRNYSDEIQQNEDLLRLSSATFSEINAEVESLQKQIVDVNEQIVMETSKLIKLDTDVPTDIEALEARKITAEKTLNAKKIKLADDREKLAIREKGIADINIEIKKIEDSDLEKNHNDYNVIVGKINVLQQQIELKKVAIRGKLEKVARLAKHKYDPNCKFCIDNSFVKDATKAKAELSADKIETDDMLKTLEEYEGECNRVHWVEKMYEKYTKFLTDRNILKDECTLLSKNIIISTNELEKLNASYNSVIHQIEVYHHNEASVGTNIKIQSNITSYRNTLTTLDSKYQMKHKMLMEVVGKKELFKSNIQNLTKTMNDVMALEYEYELYQNYLLAVGRDGIPYQVICNMVPEIEREVNSILSQVADHTIEFETDGKNIIPYIFYSDKGKWNLELSSGYERFVSSIAIRVALTNISNLPKPSFLAVDEGFGTLDPENISSMPTLFSFLKSHYDFIIVISHLDALKDAVDKTIEISNVGGFGKVVYE